MSCTIKDIARVANVSHPTVSRILSGSQAKHSQKTKERVQAIAAQMGYTPNSAARMMRNRQSNLIAIAARTNVRLGHFRLLEKCSEELAKRNYVPMTLDVRALNDKKNIDILSLFSGIICETQGQLKSLLKLANLKSFNKPVILLRKTNLKNIPSVHYDSTAGMRLLMNHLVELGHRRIVWAGFDLENMRYKIFMNECKRLSLEGFFAGSSKVSSKRYEEIDNFQLGLATVDNILKFKSATAVVASNDEFALGIISGLKKHGISIPGDLSVAGFENMSFSLVSDPPLTTVEMFPELVAANAAKQLISMIEHKQIHSEFDDMAILPELITRKSTGGIKS
jgi:DNA-binding LacI/PurR family transcriptional regulator